MGKLSSKSSSACASGLVLEVTLVVLIGGILAFVANLLSPRGLALGRDYFPPAPAIAETAPPSEVSSPEAPTIKSIPGIATVSRADVEQMTRDPRFVTRKLLLIDARNLAAHEAGHIPGSLQFDHFRPEQNVGTVLPACLSAEQIVIYCHGGNCDDSRFTFNMLQGFGVPASRFAIYMGGFVDWQSAGLPVQSSNP